MSEFFKVSQNPIHELEVFPVFVAIAMCGAGDTKVPWLSTFVNYIDNESARMAYICGSGETTFSSCHIADFVDAESQLQHRSWFGRCPSASNPADGASRLDLTWFEGRNVEHTKLSWEGAPTSIQIKWGTTGQAMTSPHLQSLEKRVADIDCIFFTALPFLLIFTLVHLWCLFRDLGVATSVSWSANLRIYIYIYIYIHIRIRELLFEVFFYGWGVPLLVELEIRYWPDFFGEKKLLGASWG